MATSKALQVKRLATFNKVMQGLIQGLSVAKSCEEAGIAMRTWQGWLKSGQFDEALRDARQELQIQTLSQIGAAFPGALQQLCLDIQGETLSARDRDQRFRTMLLLLKQVIPDIAEEPVRGNAQEWLKENAHRFPPIGPSVVIEGNAQVVVQQSSRYEPVRIAGDVAEGEYYVVNGKVTDEPESENASPEA